MSSATSLKEELFNLKNRLETIESQLTSQSKEIESREKNWENIENSLNFVINTQGERIRLNIGGTIFSTSINTLMTIRDSFLARLVESGKVDIKEEIFIDRSPRIFPIILDYYRFKKIDYKKLTKNESQLLRDEANYYAISDICNYLDERLKEPSIIAMETNGEYKYQGVVAGTNKVEDLNSTDLLTGVCVTSPGKIIVELNAEWDFKEMEIGGWIGNEKIWYPDNGSGSKIYASVDKIKWTQVGSIPSGYGKKIKTVKLTKLSTARYVKFEGSSYLGIGYIRIIKQENWADE